MSRVHELCAAAELTADSVLYATPALLPPSGDRDEGPGPIFTLTSVAGQLYRTDASYVDRRGQRVRLVHGQVGVKGRGR